MADVEFLRFKKLLKARGHFVTKPRMRMFGLLQHHPAVTVKKLLDLVEKHDRSTVYRNLDLFEKLGIITKVQLGWKTRIELSDMFRHHHHHMSCNNCGKVYVLKDNPRVEKEIARIASASKFQATDHSLEIRGLCDTCRNS